ncbi:thaumatin-like protein [Mycena leptocephala]|nr:thaumatin-like protein [Mycena leptocephala]
MISFVALSLAMASTVAAQRTMTVYNACPFTIWPALFTSSGGHPTHATGWVAPSYTKETFTVPSDWDGRIWGRRNCDFSKNPGPNSCLDGGCNGGLLCDVNTGTVSIVSEFLSFLAFIIPQTGCSPATLAEFNFNGGGISLVDGYNLPIRIDNNVGCAIPSCPVDLGPNCPSAQKGPFDASGFAVGCNSACNVDALNGKAENSPNCCSGQYGTKATCPSSGVANYAYFKGNCPNSYAYAYDESSGTALWTCPTNKNAAYTITFCPRLNKLYHRQRDDCNPYTITLPP